MQFEWEDEKAESNLRKHGISFRDAARAFPQGVVLERVDRFGEERWLAVSIHDEREITIIFTRRPESIRIISARRARTSERKRYHSHNLRRTR